MGHGVASAEMVGMPVVAIEALVPQTMGGRIGGVALLVALVLGTVYLANRFYSVSFFNGFLVAIGLFATVDLIVVHWLMELHRITSGEEATWIEVVLAVVGIVFIALGLRGESRAKEQS